MKYSEYAGLKWGELNDNDKKLLLKNAICRETMTGSPLTKGEGMVEFAETLAVLGAVYDGNIVIDDEAELYNPCIGNDGKPLTEEDLEKMFEEYKDRTENEALMDEFEYYMKKRPHVVILGAGASCAAIPNGDKYGKKISAMSGFIEKLGLTDILSKIDIHTSSDNLEDIYMEIDERSQVEEQCKKVKEELEKIIWEYMSNYELPDSPTIYDFLVLSLTEKDLIVTFNWDPLLVQAICRVQRYTRNIPQVAFLHGNVAVGFCEDDNIMGNVGMLCRCGKTLKPMKLLFPVKKKDYSNDIAIRKSWKTFNSALEKAYMITIFGYSAPKSDIEAIAMMKKAWGAVSDRNLEEIEIIDIRKEDDVIDSWNQFIHTHHYSYHTSFFDSTLARCPRRTCEATFDRLMNCIWLDGSKGFKESMSFGDIENYIYNLIEEEKNAKGKNKVLSNPYH